MKSHACAWMRTPNEAIDANNTLCDTCLPPPYFQKVQEANFCFQIISIVQITFNYFSYLIASSDEIRSGHHAVVSRKVSQSVVYSVRSIKPMRMLNIWHYAFFISVLLSHICIQRPYAFTISNMYRREWERVIWMTISDLWFLWGCWYWFLGVPAI